MYDLDRFRSIWLAKPTCQLQDLGTMLETLLFWILPIVCWPLPSYTIGRKGTKVYNRRYTLVPHFVAKWFGLDAIYIHHFQSGDPTTHVHNHPYTWGVSRILAGGYREQVLDYWYPDGRAYYTIRSLLIGARNLIMPSVLHRIDLLDPKRGCWTLFVAGKKHNRGWGFLDVVTGVFTPWSGKDPSAVYEAQ